MLTTESIACPHCGQPAALVLWQPADEAAESAPPKRSRRRSRAKPPTSSSKRSAYNDHMRNALREGASMSEAHAAWRQKNGKPAMAGAKGA